MLEIPLFLPDLKREFLMIEEIDISGLDNTLAVFRLGNREHFGDDLNSPWIFRGLRDPSWELTPKVWRPNFLIDYPPGAEIQQLVSDVLEQPPTTTSGTELRVYGDQKRISEALTRLFVEYQLLRNFFFIAEDSNVQSFSARMRDDLETNVRKSLQMERWFDSHPESNAGGMAQHYGVPTRLLDWTRDPLTALYFALLGAGDDDSVIWALNSADPTKLAEPKHSLISTLTLIEPSRMLDRRIGSQNGNFTFVQRGEVDFVLKGNYPKVDEIVENDRSIRRYKINLNPDERLAAKKALFRERRTMAHLMPDLRSSWDVAEDYFLSGLRF